MLFLSVRAEERRKGSFPEHADNIRLLLPINCSSNTSDQSFTFSFQTAFGSVLKLEPGRKSSAGTLEEAKHTDLTYVCYCAGHKTPPHAASSLHFTVRLTFGTLQRGGGATDSGRGMSSNGGESSTVSPPP